MKHGALSFAIALLSVSLSAGLVLGAEDYFEGWDVPDDPAGWIANTTMTTVTVVNAGGNPGGYLFSFGDVGGTFDIGATTELPQVSDDYAAAGVFEVSFDVRFVGGNFDDAWFRVRYQDGTFNGWMIPFTNAFPLGVWNSYVIPFDPTWSDVDAVAAGWVQESSFVVSFAQTMSNVYHPEIRISGEGFLEACIDNFRLRACTFPTPILSADFDGDVVNAAPDLTLPGSPTGDSLVLNESAGTVRVRNAVGTLVNKPIEMNQVPGIGGLDVRANVAGGGDCDLLRVSWRSLARSNSIFFMTCVLRSTSGLILADVDYRSNGQLTHNSVGGVGPTLPVTYTPDVDQEFQFIVDMVAATTSLSVDGIPMVGFQNVPFPQAATDLGSVRFEGGGTGAQDFAVDDISVVTCDCPCDLDVTPPEIQVTLNSYELWPPNHKLADICATVTVTDDCDSNPTFVLVSVTSDEPDNAPGVGDGNTVNDIQGADLGTDDVKFLLRSERQGTGDGRKYTIVYIATDAAGNTAEAIVCVTVPHDQGASALAASGFNVNGTGFEEGSAEFTVVILHKPARMIDASRIFVGNLHGFYEPTSRHWADVNGDNTIDLVVRFDTQSALPFAQGVDEPLINGGSVLDVNGEPPGPEPIALRYLTKSGEGYLVKDIFKLRQIDGVDGGEDPDMRGITVLSEPGLSLSPDGIKLTLAQAGFVEVDVFSVLGRKVRTLVNRQMSSGTHLLVWNGLNDRGIRVSDGVYFYRLNAPGLTQVQRVIRIR